MRSLTPRKNLLDKLSYSPGLSSQKTSGSRSRVSSSSSSPVSTPTPKGLFMELKRQQSRYRESITTYFAGELHVVEYPLTPRGTRVKPSLVWSVLKTYNMPQLYCFHEEKAYTHPVGHGLSYVAECGQRKGKCGYYVNFNFAYQNTDGPTKLYRSNQVVEAGVDPMHYVSNESIAPESNNLAENIGVPNVTPPSSGPVRTPRRRQANNSTVWVTPRSTQRLKKARSTEPAPYTSAESDPTSTPAPTYREPSAHDYSQPPYTQEDPPHSTYHANLFYSIHEIMLDLESAQGLKQTLFWHYFKECEDCGCIARADVHTCPAQENQFEDADGVDGAMRGNGYEADEESSPIRDGNTAPPVQGRKMLVIDLTLDDSD